MATRIQRIVVDDLDGSTDEIGTYRFALEGVEYEIDLSQANQQRLRAALAPFTSAGRRQPKRKPASRRTTGLTGPTTATKRVRRWWADNAERDDLPPSRANGPIPPQVYDAYRSANPADRV
ncbi:histone-like nucleoid-structuring protein Lsr2 [Salinispora arenicola]|uniref:histone-like nucleoid-structuring protein Lsr2 n=1 Tax=Salinispora arenicola TaxID=168697 RepID=UPI00035EDEEC|nr:Lsr2 family protein [Salinispora arenicola]